MCRHKFDYLLLIHVINVLFTPVREHYLIMCLKIICLLQHQLSALKPNLEQRSPGSNQQFRLQRLNQSAPLLPMLHYGFGELVSPHICITRRNLILFRYLATKRLSELQLERIFPKDSSGVTKGGMGQDGALVQLSRVF